MKKFKVVIVYVQPGEDYPLTHKVTVESRDEEQVENLAMSFFEAINIPYSVASIESIKEVTR
jgi:hypothetical protein